MYLYAVILIVSGLFLSLGSVGAGQTDDNEEMKQFYPNITSDYSQNNEQPEYDDEDEFASGAIDGEPVPPFHILYPSPGSESIPASIGAQPTTNGHSMLWHVGVYSKRFTPYMQICGGTLVTMKAVISAAHCFWSDVEGAMPAEDFAVGTGKRFRPWDFLQDNFSQMSQVSAIHIPVRYHDAATSYQEDIAVLLLAQEFTVSQAVRPACVNFEEDFDNEQLEEGNLGTILGWGLTEEDGDPSQILNFLELPTVSIEECLKSADASFLRYITSDKICAGVTTGKALCRGDSGGGLVFTEQRGSVPVPYLRGVASTAPRNEHRCNAYALAALTHVHAHRAFLRRYIPNLEDECRRHYPLADALKVRYSNNEPAVCQPVQVTCNCFCQNATTS
ncbi:proclotting enzyme-like isoform X1 [Choristoneura fumiferana]|uniref:proclotting enzyme-like isoform X1 n=1 Tax=Choristoneura fumiferana TaxID=7141 RepID=UPI003D15563C